MTILEDHEVLRRFEAGQLDADEFSHERHVRVAWLLARRDGPELGLERLIIGIRGIATRAGQPTAFHLTTTRAWFELIALVDDLDSHPELLDRDLLARYYSPGVLGSGRERWVEPDLHPLTLPPLERPALDLVTVLRQLAAPVAVLSAHSAGVVHGTTVSSPTSLSLEPPLMLVCLREGSRALALAEDAGRFTLSFLSSEQGEVAERFADASRPIGHVQFAGVSHRMTKFGPIIDPAIAWFGCTVAALHPGGDHRIMVGEIGDAGAGSGHPLLRYGGAFR